MKTKAFCAIVVPMLAIGSPAGWPAFVHVRSTLVGTPAGQAVASALVAPPVAPLVVPEIPVDSVELQTAVERRVVIADFRGNGRNVIDAKLTNMGTSRLKVEAEVGEMFEAGWNTVILVRPASVEIAPGKTAQLQLATVATRAANKLSEQSYKLSHGRLPKLDRLLAYAQEHPEFTAGAVQTAVLAVTENLPLSAVCKFTPIAGELKSRFNSDAFRVDTLDLILALSALRELGVPDASVVMTIDPQLKVEAMIEPLCRAAAMRYYGITAATEWEFWKGELLRGEPSTRHYALYGIARFYPEVALEMLPKWARETKTNPVFRTSALQALADTKRPEALPLLRQLADELGLNTELGRAAVGAAEFLDEQLAAVSAKHASVTFRTSGKLERF